MNKISIVIFDIVVILLISLVLMVFFGYFFILILLILNYFISKKFATQIELEELKRDILTEVEEENHTDHHSLTTEQEYLSKGVIQMTFFFFNNAIIFAFGTFTNLLQWQMDLFYELFDSLVFIDLTILFPIELSITLLFFIPITLIVVPLIISRYYEKHSSLKEKDVIPLLLNTVPLNKTENKLFLFFGFITILILSNFLTLFFHECGHALFFIILDGESHLVAVNPFLFMGFALGSFNNPSMINSSWMLFGGNLMTIILGLIILLSLLNSKIRNSVFFCFLNFTLGIFGIASGLIQLCTHSIRYMFGSEYYADTIGLLYYQSQIGGINAWQIVLITFPLILILQIILIHVSKKLWQFHFNSKEYYNRFLILNEIIFFGYFIYHLAF